MIGKGNIYNELYHRSLIEAPSDVLAAADFSSIIPPMTNSVLALIAHELWHYRLGHIFDSCLSLLSKTLPQLTSN